MEDGLDVWLVEQRIQEQSEGDLDALEIRLEVLNIACYGTVESEDCDGGDDDVENAERGCNERDVLNAADAWAGERRE